MGIADSLTVCAKPGMAKIIIKYAVIALKIEIIHKDQNIQVHINPISGILMYISLNLQFSIYNQINLHLPENFNNSI